MEVSSEDLKYKHPFTCIISGPTSSGKTVLMRRILENWKDLISIQTENIKVIPIF
jgi:Ni2+-binding GTPase involved in maturation of urease and hydrogenase